MQSGPVTPSFWQQFFRNTGLGAINDFTVWLRGCRQRSRKHRDEQKKVAVSSSRWLALSRCGVHILPTFVSIAIIAINFRGDFIGIDFNSRVKSETMNIALLQTAAKIQELLIVASLATIVFQLTRDELLFGDGIPLGLLAAGVDFTKLSFFWSPQTLGSLRSLFRGPRKHRRILLAIYLPLAGALALLAGPSCAVLLVPQVQDWPAGGTPVSLNGTAEDFWPVELTIKSSQAAVCSSSTGIRYGVCPSGGYQSLWSHYSRLDNSTYANLVPPYAYNLSGNHYYWSIDSMPPVSTRTISLGEPHPDVYIVQPHLSASIVLDQLMKDWWSALLASKLYEDSEMINRQAASTHVRGPLVRVRCAPADLLSSSNHTVQFPTFDSPMHLQAQDIAGSKISDKPTNHVQFSWFTLPESFESVTTGAVLQSAWSSDDQARLVVGCSISAHWVYTEIRSDSYSFWQGWYPKSVWFGDPYPWKGGQLLNGTIARNDAIVADQSWLDALTPSIPVDGPGYFDWGPSTIESILSSVRITDDIGNNATTMVNEWQPQGNSNRPGLLASVIASIFADGLSRAGIDKLYKAQGKPSQWKLSPYEKEDDFDRLVLKGQRALQYPKDEDDFIVSFAISGLNYQYGLAQMLAMIVLFVHMGFALLHTTWTMVRGKSSACWDSTTEIVVLAQNSKPAFQALRNTAAGVQYSSTFAKKVIVRPTKLSEFGNVDHLELLLQEEEARAENEMIDVSPPNIGPSHSATSSDVQVDAQFADTANIQHSSTWPTYRRYGHAPSTPLLGLQRSGPASTSRPSIFESSDQDPYTALESRTKIDHAYG